MTVCVRVQVLGEHDETPTTDDLVEASANQELDKSPSAALRVQEAILKELTNEDVHKVHIPVCIYVLVGTLFDHQHVLTSVA